MRPLRSHAHVRGPAAGRVVGRVAVALVALAALLLAGVEPAVAAPAGTLDPTFATEGVLVAPGRGAASSFAVSGGRLFVATAPRWDGTTAGETEVLALTEDGRLDTSFGVGGVVEVPDTFDWLRLDRAAAGALHVSRNTGDDWRTTRFDASGHPDPTYGAGGTVVLPHNVGATMVQWTDEAFDASGAMTVLGLSMGADGRALLVVRFDAAGRLVTTFGHGGVTALALDRALIDRPVDVVLDGTGRAIVLIESADGSRPSLVLRLAPDGAPDPTFGLGGAALATRGMHATQLAVDQAGRVVLLGWHLVPITLGEMITVAARLQIDGTPDLGFGLGGVFNLPHVRGLNSRPGQVVVDRAGRTLLSVSIGQAGSLFGGVLRLDANGAPDPTFGFGTGAGAAMWPSPSSVALGVDDADRPLVGGLLLGPPTEPCPPNCGHLLVRRLLA